MTPSAFRQLALSLPETEERAHMDHPDFRVAGKIFATLGYPDRSAGMVKLAPEQQHYFCKDEPAVFAPEKGAWGRWGCTRVNLKAAKKETLRQALQAAWRNTAPKRLLKSEPGGGAPQHRHTHAPLRVRMQEVRSPLRKNPEIF